MGRDSVIPVAVKGAPHEVEVSELLVRDGECAFGTRAQATRPLAHAGRQPRSAGRDWRGPRFMDNVDSCYPGRFGAADSQRHGHAVLPRERDDIHPSTDDDVQDRVEGPQGPDRR